VKAEEGRDLAKRMDCPVFFEDLNNLLVGLTSGTEAEKIISGTAKYNGSFMKDTAVDGGISTVWKELKVIENDGFNMFLPFEIGIDATLGGTIHGNGKGFNHMVT
jgi:hypothetical protein